MDHHLEESLNLDSSMSVDFDHTEDTVVTHTDLDSSVKVEGIPMKFENIEEQQMLMDSHHEEIIVPDLIEDQFTLHSEPDYITQESQTLDHTGTIASNVEQRNLLSSEAMMDLQFESPTLVSSTPNVTQPAQYITIKAESSKMSSSVPKQIAIAPKRGRPMVKTIFTQGKQYAIAPKPLTVTSVNRAAAVVKKVPLSSIVQGQKSGQTVIAHIGKQLVVMPANAAQKFKFVQSSGQPIQGQLVTAKNVSSTQTVKKPVVTKLIVQGLPNTSVADQTVVGKLTTTSGTTPRYVTIQPKAIPISMANKVILGSPTEQGIRYSKPKHHIVAVQSSPSKPAPTPPRGVQKKLVLTNSQGVVLKAALPQKNTKVLKADGTTTSTPAQRTQLHQINVPGKGIQYIRLVTNPTSTASTKVVQAAPAKQQNVVVGMPTKTIVVTDPQGNIIQVATDNVDGNQPPPLVMSSGATLSKVSSIPQQKLLKIEPVSAKPMQSNPVQSTRSGQSLLAPLSMEGDGERQLECAEDSKAALQALIADAVGDGERSEEDIREPDGGDGRGMSPDRDEDEESEETLVRQDQNEIMSKYINDIQDNSADSRVEDSFRMAGYGNVPAELANYAEPQSPPLVSENELDLRPRKACNCTKSQCLKLYCDCFANGEFCNRCNCTNCHNNLENEELRQKAIRGCLDRNPNAFRPKIGKSKAGGPEIIRRHNKGCNCKRSGCLKNYCECYEAKIACSAICKCYGCRNVEEAGARRRERDARDSIEARDGGDPTRFTTTPYRQDMPKHPCNLLTMTVIEAVCQCLLKVATDAEEVASGGLEGIAEGKESDPVKTVLDEFAACLQDVISVATHPRSRLHEESM